MRLHYRIVLPFAAVAIVATGVSAYVALSVARRALESRLETQIRSAASLIARSDFALNPTILRSVKAIAGADVITFGADRRILATTLGPSDAAVVSAVTATAVVDRALATGAAAQLACGAAPCRAAFRRLEARPGAVVAVVADTSDLSAATAAVTRAIVIAAALSLGVMLLVSQLVARRVTAPLEELVRFAEGVSLAESTRRAPVAADEVGRLGRAFNDMLDRLEHSRQALVRSEKLAAAGLIAAQVAHDIRNPLSAIKMQAQLLRARLMPAGDEMSRQSVEAVLHDVGQVESVIRDLIELARPSEPAFRPTRLRDVAADVLSHLAPQLTHRHILVAAAFDPHEPEIPLDTDRLRQALVNVVNNAADAMPNGGRLTVSTAWDAAASTVRLDVCDDGVGIDPVILSRAFDPFVTTKRDGVGLGLVNARAVVERHGGQIELAPIPPHGTRATIRIPARTTLDG